MKDSKYILLLLVIIGLAGTLVYFLARKPKQPDTKDANVNPATQPPANTTNTNISMTAEGKPFSTLYGISQIFNSLNPLMQSIPGLFNAIKNPQQQQGTQQNFDKELFCKAQPLNPICY